MKAPKAFSAMTLRRGARVDDPLFSPFSASREAARVGLVSQPTSGEVLRTGATGVAPPITRCLCRAQCGIPLRCFRCRLRSESSGIGFGVGQMGGRSIARVCSAWLCASGLRSVSAPTLRRVHPGPQLWLNRFPRARLPQGVKSIGNWRDLAIKQLVYLRSDTVVRFSDRGGAEAQASIGAAGSAFDCRPLLEPQIQCGTSRSCRAERA